MNKETGQIKRESELTEEEKKSGRWMGLSVEPKERKRQISDLNAMRRVIRRSNKPVTPYDSEKIRKAKLKRAIKAQRFGLEQAKKEALKIKP